MAELPYVDPNLFPQDEFVSAGKTAERMLELAVGGDVVMKMCVSEILQFACDILAELDEEYSPSKVLCILVAIGTRAQGGKNMEKWAKYTREDARLVVAHMRSQGAIPREKPDQPPWEPNQ